MKANIIFLISILFSIIIGYLDYQTGAHISMMLFYSIPILVSAWFCGKSKGISTAIFAATCWFAVNFIYKGVGESDAVFSWNALTRLGIFCLIAYTISLQAKLHRALERERLRADTDRLTGLFNKAAFRERVGEEMNRARRYSHPLSLAFIDLDNFKQVNDTVGHARGDKLLQQVSETIVNSIRGTDIAGRIGGDEFTICFPETGEAQARNVIAKMMKALDIMTSQSGWQVTASVGVVTCTEVCDTYDAILGKADKLMYAAKGHGKNKAEFMTIGTS